jgi:hypothetical protein
MPAQPNELDAVFLIGGMAIGVLVGSVAFPEIGAALGETMADWAFGAAGAIFAGVAHETVASLIRLR